MTSCRVRAGKHKAVSLSCFGRTNRRDMRANIWGRAAAASHLEEGVVFAFSFFVAHLELSLCEDLRWKTAQTSDQPRPPIRGINTRCALPLPGDESSQAAPTESRCSRLLGRRQGGRVITGGSRGGAHDLADLLLVSGAEDFLQVLGLGEDTLRRRAFAASVSRRSKTKSAASCPAPGAGQTPGGRRRGEKKLGFAPFAIARAAAASVPDGSHHGRCCFADGRRTAEARAPC